MICKIFRKQLLFTVLCLFLYVLGCTGHKKPAHEMAEPMPPSSPPKEDIQLSSPKSVSDTAEHFATSYNQAVQDRNDFQIAASNNDYQRSQELIRSYNQHMNLSRDSHQILQEIAEKQGTGDITIFFPTNSAVISENDFQYHRLVRYLDSLERNNQGRKLVFVIMGSASATGEENHNLVLSKARAQAPIPIIDHYLINVPHSFHKVYGVGETDSPKNVDETVNKRYQFVKIMALYEVMPPRTNGTLDFGEDLLSEPDVVSLGEPREYTNSIGMKFIRVPTGSFMMGSPDTEIRRDKNEIYHQVTLTQPFYLQTTEVTQQQWYDVMGTNPSHLKLRDDLSGRNVRYSDVMMF